MNINYHTEYLVEFERGIPQCTKLFAQQHIDFQ